MAETGVQSRLSAILNADDHAVYVALAVGGRAIAWIHVFKSLRVESGLFAEIGGLVVAESHRRQGIGKALLMAAKRWAIKNRLPKLRVRTNISREGAKAFYSKMGFSISKQQRVFDKPLT